MAITFSNPISPVGAAANIILTQSYTVPVGAKELWVFVYADNSNATTPLPDLVEYGGVNATLVSQIPADAGGTGQLHFFYKIINPAVGTANIRARHPTYFFAISAVCLASDNTYSLTYSAFNYANSASPSASVASANNNKTLYSLTVNNVNTTAIGETGGQTVLSEGGSATQAMHQISEELSTGATNSATWTVTGGAQRWSAIAINVSEDNATVTTINNGNPITVGQTSVPAAHNGFDGAVDSITTNRAGVTASIISGNSTSTNFSISGWAEASTYPVLDNSVTFTFSRTGQSASAAQTVTRPTGWSKQTFVGAIIDDERLFGKIFSDHGHTVEGAVLYYNPSTVPGLFIKPDTSADPLANGGTFDAWLQPSQGTTAGKTYYFQLSIEKDGTPVAIPKHFYASSVKSSRVKAHRIKAMFF